MNIRCFALILIAVALPLLGGCTINLTQNVTYDTLTELEVQPAERALTRDKVLLVDCSGEISSNAATSLLGLEDAPSMLLRVMDALEAAQADKHVKAVILRIDSPGGEVTASDIIYRELKKFKEERLQDNPNFVLVAAMMDLAASGGYYIAMAADRVYALPTTVTGSIGVISVFPELEDLLGKLGVGIMTVKSGALKDSGSLFRKMRPDEQQLFQNLINEMYGKFVDIVAENRKELSRDEVLKLADGRVYSAKEALEHKLIDGVNYLDEVIDITKALAQLKDAKVVTYRYNDLAHRNIYAIQPLPQRALRNGDSVNLINIDAAGLLGKNRPRLQYRFVP